MFHVVELNDSTFRMNMRVTRDASTVPGKLYDSVCFDVERKGKEEKTKRGEEGNYERGEKRGRRRKAG